jgi:hypothetical protein
MKNQTHLLKILPAHFADVLSGKKKAEFRRNDRAFQEGDRLVLREFDGSEYTGMAVSCVVTCVTQLSAWIAEEYVMLSIDGVREYDPKNHDSLKGEM